MDNNALITRIAHPQSGEIRTVLITVIVAWLVTLGVSIPLSFAHHPLMDKAAPVAGPILLLLLMSISFITAGVAGQITYDDRQTSTPGPFREYALAVLYRLRWLMAISIGLAPLALIVLFYRTPELPFADSIQLWQDGLLLLPFVGLLALHPLTGIALGVWCGMRLRSRWLAVISGPILLLVVLGLELGLERLRVIQSEPIIIGDTIEYPDMSGLQSIINILLAVDGLSAVAVGLLLFFQRSDRSS